MAPGLWAAVCAVLISACGGGGDEGAPAAVTGSPASPSASGDPAAVVATIKGDATGVTATEIRIGSYYPKTGPSAIHDHIEKGWTLYFDEVNRKGGIAGRKVRFLVEDDAFNPSITVAMVKKLVEQDQVFMLFNGLGTPTSLATVGYLEQHGVPSLFIASGASRWATAGPAFIGLQPDFVAEGRALGEFMLRNFPGKKYGIIFQNDDMGKSGRDGIKAAVGTGLTLVGEETYEANAADITSQALKLINAGAEVIGVYSTPTQFAGMLKSVKAQGKTVAWYASSTTAGSAVAKLAEGAMDGVFSATYLPDVTDPSPEVQKVIQFYKDHGVANPNVYHLVAWAWAQHLERLLTVTGKNLNRSSIIYALENLAFQGDWKADLVFKPSIVTKDDHKVLEAMVIQKWNEAAGKFEYDLSKVVDSETTKR